MGFLKGAKDEVIVNIKAEVSGDFGKKIVIPFKARYRRYSVSEGKELMARIQREELTDEELVRQVLIDWRDMLGNDGEEVPFSQEALADAMEILGYRKALIDGFVNQQYEIDIKNSSR